ncbi:LINE-1 reverse transcriptase isogeny [Gossypium australe]|uniref:LINE-1 reverse transcriptase isogeny n=1 Tax=Gossypium australe TaxID=47621 RepID=A0A5B6WC23_9ROSI|nr:LINE-1 reverse transcriptase isogeny [Gossypium australe]
MQILWNGVRSRSFKPVKGMRQGCPLSPYLFVFCMEWLGHLISLEIIAGRWHPIRLSRSGPTLSHLFFADDLVIFSKGEMDQTLLLKETLRRFCDFSGHKISARNSNMFFSKVVDTSLCDQISQLFGFQNVLNLGSYLGVPLLHDRVTRSTLNFMVEKVRSKLQNWEVRKLSFAGRVTLAQSVLPAIPSYFMQSLVVPKGVCDEIEKIARQFIWGGSAGHPKSALVGWESIYILCISLPDAMFALVRLFTNSEWTRREIGQSSVCPRCGHDIEDIMHMLWDCSTIKEACNPSREAIQVISNSSGIHHHCSDNWVHLFSDGAVARVSENASVGGMVRDRDGYKRVKIQTDNLEVVRALSMEDTVDFGITLLRRVKRLLHSECQCEIKHVPRECNLIADRLAKIYLS